METNSRNDYVKMANDREREWMTALNIHLNAESFRVDQTGGMTMVPTFKVDDEFDAYITPPEHISELGGSLLSNPDEWLVGLNPLDDDRWGMLDDAFTEVANGENAYVDIVAAVHALIAKHTMRREGDKDA